MHALGQNGKAQIITTYYMVDNVNMHHHMEWKMKLIKGDGVYDRAFGIKQNPNRHLSSEEGGFEIESRGWALK